MHHGPEFTTVLITSMTLAAGAATRLFSARTRIPYTIAMLVLGLITGFALLKFGAGIGEAAGEAGGHGGGHGGGFLDLLAAGAMISPDLIIFAFLPALIFESAYAMDLHTFKKSVGAASILAVPALLVATALTALLMLGLTGLTDTPWPLLATLVFGSLISATDPVAVVALLRELGVSKKLATLIEGESLLNDGTAIVVFTVLIAMMKEPDSSFELVPTLVQFVRVVAGGLLVGLVLAAFVSWWMGRIFNDSLVEITLTLVLGYSCMIIAEGMLHVSGVMALVVAGLWMGGPGRTKVSPEVSHFLHQFWEMLAYIANTVVFYIVGLVIGSRIESAGLADVGIIIAAWAGIMAIRFFVVFLHRPLTGLVGEKVAAPDAAVASWGGLRGAVSMALALIVAQDPAVPHELGQKILLITAGVVLMTILVNGMTMKHVLAYFGFDKPPLGEQLALLTAKAAVLEEVADGIRRVSSSRELRTVSWADVETDIEHRSGALQLELEAMRGELVSAPQAEQEAGYWRQILEVEREAYWRAFATGTLSAAAVRILNHEIDLQLDRSAHGDGAPPETRTPQLGGIRAWVGRQARSSTVLGRQLAAFEFENLALVYDLSRAESSAASKVVAHVESIKDIDAGVAEQLKVCYRDYQRIGKERVEEMRVHLPEVTRAIETRLAKRIALNFEREGYHRLAHGGAIDVGTAERLAQGVEAEMQRLTIGAREMPLPTIPELLHAIPLFEALDQTALGHLAEAAKTIVVPGGEMLFRQGDRGESMYVITRGAAHVLLTIEGNEVLLDVLGGGDILGEIALLTGERRTASIRAATAVTLVEIDRTAFASLASKHPELLDQVWDAFAQRRFDNHLRDLPAFRHLDRAARTSWIAGCGHFEVAADEMRELPFETPWLFVLTGTVKLVQAEYSAPSLFEVDGPVTLFAKDRARVVKLPAWAPEDEVAAESSRGGGLKTTQRPSWRAQRTGWSFSEDGNESEA